MSETISQAQGQVIDKVISTLTDIGSRMNRGQRPEDTASQLYDTYFMFQPSLTDETPARGILRTLGVDVASDLGVDDHVSFEIYQQSLKRAEI
jgi:hypothetical protein